MESKHLVYLSTILEKGSITAASEQLNVAQPTLTRAMATLEMQAGTQLFTRSRFGVSSTPVGESLAREGREITMRLNSAQEKISRFKLGIKQNLRIASGSLLSLEVLPIIMERMLEQHPEVSLTVTCINPALALESLMDDQFDIIIAPQPSEKTTINIHKELIMEDKIGIFCSKKHPLANKKSLNVKDFDEFDWLSLGISSYFEKQTTEMLESYQINNRRTKIVFRNDAVMLLKVLSSGRYLAALPCFPVSMIKEDFSIVEIHLKNTTPTLRETYLMCAESPKDQLAYQSFKKITHEVFTELANKNMNQ